MSEPRTKDALSIVHISQDLLDQTGLILAGFAAREPAEGIVYWFGVEVGAMAVVTTLVVPRADTSRGYIVTSAAANAEALMALVGSPVVLLGQAHSHPAAKVQHSTIDDRDTFAQFPGAISLVVPWFGHRGVAIDHCGVHRYLGGRYRLLKAGEVPLHLVVLPSVIDLRAAGMEPAASRFEIGESRRSGGGVAP